MSNKRMEQTEKNQDKLQAWGAESTRKKLHLGVETSLR